jgi:hypothetical protein
MDVFPSRNNLLRRSSPYPNFSIILSEAMWFASIPMLGKEGFETLKKETLEFFSLKRGPISETRHRIGLFVFFTATLLQLLMILMLLCYYCNFIPFERITCVKSYIVLQTIIIIGFIISTYLLGRNFIHKVFRSLK